MNLPGLYWKQASCTLNKNKLLHLISLSGGQKKENVLTLFTNHIFWKIFDFGFL
ncbi:MAG: hypothetical protein LIP00_05535 [Parabacteroides sp.]|nr:hypothetical protein [Parabacteroides sp.]